MKTLQVHLRQALSDVLIVSGTGSIGYGLWMVFPPATFIAIGAAAVAYGFALGWRRNA